jgi:D-3-phosphoglycerate dehydrogenase
MDWRIQIADKIHDEGVKRLSSRATVIEDASVASINEVDALIVRSATQVSRGVIEGGLPQLKVIGRAGVGVDNIDLAAAQEAGVIVVNAPGAATNSVAEHALALMLALARNLPAADASMKAGQWNKKSLGGVELSGRTLGIIGMGRIGSTLAEKGLALGLEILGYDPPIPNPKIERVGGQSVELDQLLARSDFISLHVPLDDDTRLMIGAAELAQMKPTAYLVSTARGGVVDEGALFNALKQGQLAGAALDVFDQEPPGVSPLIQQPNFIATPHLGSQTSEAQRRASIDIAEEVLAALAGDELRWRVA